MSILKNLFGIQKKGTSPILLRPNPTVGGQQLKPKPIKDKKEKVMKLLLELIAKLFGKGAVSKTIGSRTNVIKLADNDAKRFIQKELNILEAGDEAVRKGLKDAETLIPDIPKMNDQEILTFTGNLRRLDQRVNPPQKPAAEVLDMSTQQKVSPEGIEKLADERGIPSDVDPRSPLGSVMRRVKQMQLEGKNLADEFGMTEDLKKGLKGLSDPIPAQIQKEGLVKATANDIMIADIKSGKFPATKEMEQDILQGSPKSLDYFRRFYGEDALEVLDSLGPDLAKIRTSREAADFAKKQYNFEPKMDRAPGSISPEDAAKAEKEFGLGSLKDDIDDPEGFAIGGRVGFNEGTLDPAKEKQIKQMIKMGADTDTISAITGATAQQIQQIQNIQQNKRVDYAYGSGLKLIQLLNKAKKSLKQAIKESADDIIPTGDSKLDADMAVDNMLEKLGVDRDAVDGYDILDAYGEAYKTVTGSMLKTRKNASVFSEQYLKKIDDEIIKEGLYTRKEWAKAPETIKNKIRGQMDPDWKEANFGEDYDFDQVRGKELEEGLGGLQIDMNDVMDDVRIMKEKGLSGFRDHTKFLDMKVAGEFGPQKQMKAIKMELFNKYSKYLDDETMDVIQASNDPQKVAEVYANVREAALLSDRGVPTEEIVDTIIKTPRTKQADGTGSQGLANLLQVDKRTDYAVGGMGLTQMAAQEQAAGKEGLIAQTLRKFGDHAKVSEAMAGKTGKSVIPQYGFQTGLDFQKKFSGLDPKISAGLAAGYQTLQEGSRALNPFGDTFLRFPTAMETAQQQATENIEGILAADTGTITPEQQAARNEYLESQGQPTEPLIDQDRSSEIVEQQKAAGVPDEGLITNFDPNLTPQDAAEISKKMADDGSSTIPGFTRLKNPDGAPGNYNEFMYEGPDGQIYGAGTYGSIAAGMYPSIYDPNRPTMGRPSQYPASRYTEINGTYYDKTDPQDAAEIAKKISFGEIPNLIDRPNTNLASGGRVGYEQGGLANLLGV